jgi:GWxTD domain-containing protein
LYPFNKRITKIFFGIFLLSILFSGCNPTLNISGMDISSLYTGQKGNALELKYLFNINDSISTIGIELPAGLIKPDPGTRKYSKKGTLTYEVIGEGKRIGIVDSATFSISDTSDFLGILTHSWIFKAPAGMDYFVKATYSVPGIPEDFLLLEYFNKMNHSCQSWFRFQTESGEFFPANISAYAQPIRIVTTDSVSQILQVKCYFRNYQTPIPAFVEQNRPAFNYTPDSTFILEIKNGKSAYFTPSRIGFYFFQSDTSFFKGPTFYRMSPGFPKVTQHLLMLEALRYITSVKEFQKLKSYPVPKVAVDSFWIANAGRPDLATELIRKYYSRVETANQLYTSYTDGWKTDRGMIFMIMGKPTKVFRSFEQEVWIYGEYDDPRALKFYFNKANNPFTNNDYVLVRNQYYKSSWYQNVLLWRR